MLINTTHITFLLCLLMGVTAHSQKIDSLKNELRHQSGKERFTVLYDLVFEYLGKEDYQEALKYIEEAQQVAAQFDDSLHIVKAGRVKGQILRKLDRVSDALNEYQKVLPIAMRNYFLEEHKDLLNALALAYTLQANYDKALQFLFECLVLREKEDDGQNIGSILNNIGMVYYKLENYEKGLQYYRRARNYKTGFQDQVLINMGLCYSELNDFQTAKKFTQEGIKICAPKCSDETLMSGEFGLGKSLFGLNEPKKAEKHFLVSYHLAQKRNDKRFQIDNLINLARIKKIFADGKSAMKFLVEAESIANETAYNDELMWIYIEYSELYAKTRDYKDASFYQAKYIALRDAVYSGELTKNLMRIQAEYEERENKAKITSQEQILILKEEAIQRQRLLNLLTGTVAVLLIALALILIRVNRDKQKINYLLEQKVKERTQSLDASFAALQRSHSELEEFIVKTSRDIQNPVVTMKGLANVMLADSDTPQTTKENVKQLERIIFSLSELQNRLTVLNEENQSKKIIYPG